MELILFDMKFGLNFVLNFWSEFHKTYFYSFDMKFGNTLFVFMLIYSKHTPSI